jgi:3-oxoacyl-[acyl-carrier protein] reductase
MMLSHLVLPLMLLKNSKALVTGASRGLGLAITETLKKYGADVYGTSRSGENNTYKCDISKDFLAKSSVYQGMMQLNGLNILVCNAGIYGPIGNVENNNWDEWKNAIETNLYGTVNMCRHVLPQFKGQGFGKIIILSGGGATKAMPNFSAYAASKAAVVRFAETLAEEVKDYDIQVNCVAPGSMNTDFMETAIVAGSNKTGKDFYDRMIKQKKDGGDSIQNAAELVAFLASDKSDHISGRLISAVWDDWKNLDKKKLKPDMYTLRRIDKESML